MVYVVVLSWNYKDYTLGCLKTIFQMRYPPFHVLLVDNASTDGTVLAAREAFPQVEIQANPQDLGFAGGVNVGLEIALNRGASYVLVVSNDTLLEADLLERLVDAAEANPKAGLVSPLIYYPGRERIWYAGAYRRRFWPGVSMPGYGLRDRPRYHVRREVDYATGCVLLMRAEALRRAGLFDRAFFMYYEDLDLCERVRRAGWRILFVPDAVVEHLGSASYGELSATKWSLIARYSAQFYQRYYRWPRLSLALYLGWVAVREIVRGNARVLGPWLRGAREGWRETFGAGPRAKG